MDASKANAQNQAYRGACDQCSQRKVRCTLGNGACQNCVAWGKICTYSPKLPSGRPRKRTTTAAPTGAKEIVTQNNEQRSVQRQQSPMQKSSDLSTPNPRERILLTRSSNSLSSIESQLVTPSSDLRSLNVQDVDMSMDLFYPSNFLDEAATYNQDYFSNLLFPDHENPNTTHTDYSMSPPSHRMNFTQQPIVMKSNMQTKPRSSSAHASNHRPKNLLISPYTKTPGSGVPTFTSLLSAVMDLRSKYDSLKACSRSYAGRRQKTAPDVADIVDQTISALSQYSNETGPYLTSIHRRLSGLSTNARNQQYVSLQGTIQMITAGISIVVETSYTLHEMLQMFLCNEGVKTSTRLDNVLRFSTVDFTIGRCVRSTELIAEISSCGALEALDPENTLRELNAIKTSAESLRNDLALAIEELKTPVF